MFELYECTAFVECRPVTVTANVYENIPDNTGLVGSSAEVASTSASNKLALLRRTIIS